MGIHLWLKFESIRGSTPSFFLSTRRQWRSESVFFETTDLRVRFENHSLASGNPVKIGDGCATVTGYELPKALPGVLTKRRQHKSHWYFCREGGSKVF
jgi:hypothetical protein